MRPECRRSPTRPPDQLPGCLEGRMRPSLLNAEHWAGSPFPYRTDSAGVHYNLVCETIRRHALAFGSRPRAYRTGVPDRRAPETNNRRVSPQRFATFAAISSRLWSGDVSLGEPAVCGGAVDRGRVAAAGSGCCPSDHPKSSAHLSGRRRCLGANGQISQCWDRDARCRRATTGERIIVESRQPLLAPDRRPSK
jgi:hypothetical protein